ncbi:hypothetical protein [Desulfurobacterium sp.]
MKRLIFPVFLSFLFFSCVQKRPSVTPCCIDFSRKPPKVLKGLVKCSVTCSNGTSLSGKAVVFVNDKKAVVKVYTASGIYAGRIVVNGEGIFAGENLVPFARYLFSPLQIKSLLTGFVYQKSYKIITPCSLEVFYDNLKETYTYTGCRLKSVVVSDGLCRLTIKPISVKEVKR